MKISEKMSSHFTAGEVIKHYAKLREQALALAQREPRKLDELRMHSGNGWRLAVAALTVIQGYVHNEKLQHMRVDDARRAMQRALEINAEMASDMRELRAGVKRLLGEVARLKRLNRARRVVIHRAKKRASKRRG